MKESVRSLSPAYFALVMATGIVSIAASLIDSSMVRHGVCSAFGLNGVAYVVVGG